jgi:hypothetical protein
MAKDRKRDMRALRAALRDEIQQSEGYDSDALGSNRKQALDYYYGRDSAAPPVPGRSKVQSLDVADMVESIMSQLLPAISQESPILFPPMSEEDEDQAQQESEAVNYLIMEKNRGYCLFASAIKDALLLRNGITKVYIDETVDTMTNRYEMLSVEALAAFQMMDDPAVEVDVSGVEQNEDGSYKATIKITTTDKQLKVSAVDPTQFLITQNHDSIYLDDCPFVAERGYPTRSELVERGYDKKAVYELAAITYDDDQAQIARNRNQDYDNQPTDVSMERIETFYCYYRYDFDGDGVAELRYIVMADSEILSNEPADFIPYASGTPILQPHRFNGLSIFDKLKEVQDTKTQALRQYIDNIYSSNNARIVAVPGAVDFDDLSNSRPGGIIKAETTDAVMPLPFADTGASSQALLDYMDKVRSERGGASLDLQGAEAQIVGETAHGIERQYTAREQLAAMMCRTLAETLIASTYLNCHRAARLYLDQPVQFKAGATWLQTQSNQWPERSYVKVKPGLSTSERMQKSQALQGIIALQQQLMAGGMGGILTDQDNLHNALQDLTRAAGLDSPQRYWIDPQSPEAQQAAAQLAEQNRQTQQAQMAQAQMQSDVMALQAAFEKYKHDSELALEYYKEQLGAEIEEAKILGKATADLQVAQLQGEINAAQNRASARAAEQSGAG